MSFWALRKFYQGPHQWQPYFNATKEERFS